jgi:hypothetical protein
VATASPSRFSMNFTDVAAVWVLRLFAAVAARVTRY